MGLFQKIKEVGSKIVERIKSKFKKPKFDDPISQKMKINPGPMVGDKNTFKKDAFKPISGINPYLKMTPEQKAEADKKRAEHSREFEIHRTKAAMKRLGIQ